MARNNRLISSFHKSHSTIDQSNTTLAHLYGMLFSNSTIIKLGSNGNKIISGGNSWANQRAIYAGFNFRVSTYWDATVHFIFKGLQKGFKSYSSSGGWRIVHTHSGIFFPEFPVSGITIKGYRLHIHNTTISPE